MRIKIIPLFTAIVISATVGLAFWKIDHSRQYLFQTYSRLKVQSKASRIREKLETGMNRRLALAEGLAAYASVKSNLNQNEFEAFAKILVAGDTVIRGLDLAKNGIITHLYPFAGNEKAFGFEVLKNPEQSAAAGCAILTRKAVTAGPVKLIQGGTAFIGRIPFCIMPLKKSEKDTAAWGLANVLIKADALFREAGLFQFYGNLRFALRGRDGLGAKGTVFFGDEGIFKIRPVLLDVVLPNGSWQMAIVPAGGWLKNAPGSWKIRGFGVLMALVTGGLAYFFLRVW